MLHHTLIKIQKILSSLYGLRLIKWWSFYAHLANPAVGEYVDHPKLADDFTVEVYGTVGDKCLEVMKGTEFHLRFFSQN